MKKKTYKKKPARKQNPASLLKRQDLTSKSNTAKILMEKRANADPESPYFMLEKVNDFLMHWHKQETGIHSSDEWNTFKGWKDLGFTIKKGSLGFAIWGQPRKFKGKSELELSDRSTEEATNQYKAFPMCYLFNSAQVQDAQGNDFSSNNVFQRIAMIPFMVKNAPLAIPMDMAS